MSGPPAVRQDRKNNPSVLAAFRVNADGVCTRSPQEKNPTHERSLADIVFDETFGPKAFFLGRGDALASKDPRFTNAACLSEEELAEYAAETGDYSYDEGGHDSYGYQDGYEEVFDAYLEVEQESYLAEQYGIYEQAQYERDLENGNLACAAPWARGDEDPYDFAVTQEGTNPDAEATLNLESAPDSPVAAAFNEAASGVETAAVDPAPAEPAPAAEPEPAPVEPAKVAVAPVAAPAI